MKELIVTKACIPLRELTRISSGSGKDPVLSAKLYAQAASLVGFLIEKYGPSQFVLFCRQLRDGNSVDAALSFVYTNSIRDMDELERKWVQHYGGS